MANNNGIPMDVDIIMNPNDRALITSRPTIPRIIRSLDCATDNMPGRLREDKALKGVLLSLKHSSASKNATKMNQQYVGGYNPTKRAKLAGSYDRMTTFADLLDPPHVFVIFTYTEEETKTLFYSSRTIPVVGTPFYILEPKRAKDKLKGKLTIIEFDCPLIPLKMSTPLLSLPLSIPPSDLVIPNDANTFYFVLHSVKIEISLFRMMFNASCTGIMCDRVHPRLSSFVKCGCIDTDDSNKSAVTQFSVGLLDINGTGTDEKRIDIDQFRSFRTTQVLFENVRTFLRLGETAINIRTGEMRDSVQAMVEYINNEQLLNPSGWTVVGWCKVGEVQDSSNPGERVQSTLPVFHISLLLPTSADIRNGLDEHFNDLRIKTIVAP